MTIYAVPEIETRRDALVERLFNATLGAFDLYAVYLGDRLGLYRALASGGALTPVEPGGGGRDRRALRPRVARAAGRGRHPRRLGRPVLASAGPRRGADRRGEPGVRRSLRAVRRGGRRGRCPSSSRRSGRAPASRTPTTARTCAGRRRASRGRCRAAARQRVAPVGPGRRPARLLDRSPHAPSGGRPGSRLDRAGPGEPGRQRGGGSRSFVLGDAASPRLAGRYDLVTVFEALHDMSDPVSVLRAARGLLAGGGCVSWPTSAWRTRSRHRATTSSGSTTGSACCTACRWGCRGRGRARSSRSTRRLLGRARRRNGPRVRADPRTAFAAAGTDTALVRRQARALAGRRRLRDPLRGQARSRDTKLTQTRLVPSHDSRHDRADARRLVTLSTQ